MIIPIAIGDIAQGNNAEALRALNNEHAQELSWLDANRFAYLVKHAFHATRIGNEAFLLAFDQNAPYDSTNFLWFRARFEHFIYIDRIVVSQNARGRGYGRLFYEDLFKTATDAGHERVVCEVNKEPPNPASDAFHAALNFVEIGTGILSGGEKTVRYFAHRLR